MMTASSDTDRQQLTRRVCDFLERHQTGIGDISPVLSNVFEAACFVLFARYYEEAGYVLRAENLLEGKFRFRFSTAGLPWNFSYLAVVPAGAEAHADGAALFEIRHNQKVAGAWIDAQEEDEEPALFAVDIAVIDAGSLPDLPRGRRRGNQRHWAENHRLITLGEAKKLIAYPMLLAQFLGIVHELKPGFLKVGRAKIPQRFWAEKHPPPTLFTSDHLTAGTERVLQSFEDRLLMLVVVDNVITSPEKLLLQKLRAAVCAHASQTIAPPARSAT